MATPKQHIMTEGLILREYETVSESDRFVAILTRDKGLIRASAKGARNVKSRFGAGTQPPHTWHRVKRLEPPERRWMPVV